MVPATALIEIQRDLGGEADYFRSYKVVIDQAVAGEVRRGESRAFQVPPGAHQLYLTLDWCRSEKLDVALAAGETARFVCSPRAKGITSFYWITFGRHRYISLAPINDT